MSSFGLVNTISAPLWKGSTQPELIAFEVEFSAYAERVRQLNQTRPANQRIPPATLKQCIQPKLLHSMCILGLIEGSASAEDASEYQVKKWFDETIKSTTKVLSERVNDAIQSVKYTLKPKDPAGTPMSYILDVITSLDEHNASEVTKEPE